MSCLCVAFALWWVVRALYLRREAEKERLLAEGWSDRGEEDLTDRSPGFRYQF
jgi:hypothetical protein